jgi:hypothetical protein
MLKIIVNSEELKQELLKESKYLHNLRDIDSNLCNTLIHLYLNPDLILVKREQE